MAGPFMVWDLVAMLLHKLNWRMLGVSGRHFTVAPSLKICRGEKVVPKAASWCEFFSVTPKRVGRAYV